MAEVVAAQQAFSQKYAASQSPATRTVANGQGKNTTRKVMIGEAHPLAAMTGARMSDSTLARCPVVLAGAMLRASVAGPDGRQAPHPETTMPQLKDKVALVTGSSRGIGASIAATLAKAGAHVVVNYASSPDDAEGVVRGIVEAGGHALAVRADVSDPAEVQKMFDHAIGHFGRIDILVNNAGKVLYKKLAEVTDDEFDELWAINVKGVFNTLRQAATRVADGGRVITISSTTTRLLLPTYASYCATKAAVEQLSRVFAKEVGHRGITVNLVSPGPTHTQLFDEGKTEADFKRFSDMTALGRIGEPQDIANTVLLLASDEAGWITAQNLGANGGLA